MAHSRWIWIILVDGRPQRFEEGSEIGNGHCSFATGFSRRKDADAQRKRSTREFQRLSDLCARAGSAPGMASWKKCLETIEVKRIELPKGVR